MLLYPLSNPSKEKFWVDGLNSCKGNPVENMLFESDAAGIDMKALNPLGFIPELLRSSIAEI
jgi:hypothetical protein